MRAAVTDTEIGSRDFVVNASQERVWRLIGKVMLSSLPDMEEMEILDEKNFRAMLRVKVSFLEFKMKLKGEIADMAPPDSLAVNIGLAGLGGHFRMNQKVALKMTSAEGGKTTVACRAMALDMGTLSRVLFLGQARRFAQSTFETIERRLQELA
jgi:carbon monoxide dehydrogenase subunit G